MGEKLEDGYARQSNRMLAVGSWAVEKCCLLAQTWAGQVTAQEYET